MKRWIIDRFEGGYAVCEGERGESLLIEREKLPEDACAGSVLLDAEDGSFVPDREETLRRRKENREKLRRLLQEE